MKSAEGSSKTHKLRSQKRNNKWYSRSDVVTFDVFKREYWSHIPRYLTKGISAFSAHPSFTHSHTAPKHHPWRSVISSVRSREIACKAASELHLLQGQLKDPRNLWSTQIVLSTEKLTKVSGARIRWTMHCLKCTKNSSSSAASAISQIGTPCTVLYVELAIYVF